MVWKDACKNILLASWMVFCNVGMVESQPLIVSCISSTKFCYHCISGIKYAPILCLPSHHMASFPHLYLSNNLSLRDEAFITRVFFLRILDRRWSSFPFLVIIVSCTGLPTLFCHLFPEFWKWGCTVGFNTCTAKTYRFPCIIHLLQMIKWALR